MDLNAVRGCEDRDSEYDLCEDYHFFAQGWFFTDHTRNNIGLQSILSNNVPTGLDCEQKAEGVEI